MIISVHIPRTAGTSFRELLAEKFGTRLLHHYYHLMDHQMLPIEAVSQDAECIHGHFPATFFRTAFPHAALVTWVRRPLDRLISEYRFLTVSPDENNVLSQMIQNGASIVEFAEHPANANRMVSYMNGVPLASFAFVGISEFYNEELDRLERLTGMRLRKHHRVNSGPSSVNEVLSEKEAEYIRSLNTLDEHLYDRCLKSILY